MLLAEDLLLLLTDDDTGRLLASTTQLDVALGGARLIELTLTGRVDLTHESEGKRDRLAVRDARPTGDPLLDEALELVAAKAGRKPSAVVGPLGRKLRPRLYERLVDRVVPQVVPPRDAGVPKKQLERRAKEIAEGDWASAAVRSSIDATNAAVIAAIAAATASGGSTS